MSFLRRLRSLFCRDQLDREMGDEMRAHIDAQTQRNIAVGMSEDDARAAARRQFGGLAQVQERSRDVLAWIWLEQVVRDIGYALRSLRRSPGFAITIIVLLGLGIGANTVVFTVVNSLFLRPLPIPIPDPAGLWAVVQTGQAGKPRGSMITYEFFRFYRDEFRSFSELAAYAPVWQPKLQQDGGTRRLSAEYVSGNYFSTLGITPLRGRFIQSEKDDHVAVISYDFWQSFFHGAEDVIGSALDLDDQQLTIIGVAPAGFDGLDPRSDADLWVAPTREKAWVSYRLVARLAPGVSREQAIAELNVVAQRLAETDPNAVGFFGRSWSGTTLTPAALGTLNPHSVWRNDAKRLAKLFMGAVGFVLLIACANAANLLLARTTQRSREIAVRLALGAGRWRIARQLLTESLVLASLGGTLGIIFSVWGTKASMTLFSGRLQWVRVDPSPDWRVLAFAGCVALATGIVFGLAPALQALRFDLRGSLERTAAMATGNRRFNARNLLVVTQVATCLVLLVGAGLCLRSFAKLTAIDAGFDLDVLSASLSLDEERYTDESANAFANRLLQRLESRPEVESAAIADRIELLSGGSTVQPAKQIEDYEPAPGESGYLLAKRVGPDYFRTLGIPVTRGREFERHDEVASRSLVVVNQSLVQKYWPDQNPVGKHIGDREVIGVVGDIRSLNLWTESTPHMFELYQGRRSFGILVKTRGPPEAFAATFRSELKALDDSLQPTELQTLGSLRADSLAGQRTLMTVLGVFAAIAAFMALIGLYGLMAYMVEQRTREIGIRVAVGAQRHNVIGLILKRGLGLTVVGIACGLAAAWGLTRFLESLLYDLSPTDPLTFALIAVGFAGIATLACLAPARRATKVDPVIALRAE